MKRVLLSAFLFWIFIPDQAFTQAALDSQTVVQRLWNKHTTPHEYFDAPLEDIISYIEAAIGGGAADGNGIYSNSGSIPNNTIATVASGGVFSFDYFGGQDAIEIDDANGLFLNSPDGGTYHQVEDGGNQLVTDGNMYIAAGEDIQFNSDVFLFVASSGATAPSLLLNEPNSGSNFTGFTTQAMSADVVYTLPAAAGSTGDILLWNSGNILSWGKASLTANVSGTLPVGNGGTGSTTLTSGALLVGNGTSAVSALSLGTANQLTGINAAGTANEYKTLSLGTTAQSNDLGIVHGANSITIHIPDASTTTRGVVTTGTQNFFGTKNFTSSTGFNAPNTTTPAIDHAGMIRNRDWTTISTNTTLNATQSIIACDCTSGSVTLTAPANAAGTKGFTWHITKIDTTANPCIIDLNSTNTFTTTAQSVALYGEGQACVVVLGDGSSNSIFTAL